MAGLQFSWDEQKEKANIRKHGVSFGEAATVFADPLSLSIPDPIHSVGESRYIILGKSNQNLLLVVVHTDKRGHIRIISARKATKKERKQYEEGA